MWFAYLWAHCSLLELGVEEVVICLKRIGALGHRRSWRSERVPRTSGKGLTGFTQVIYRTIMMCEIWRLDSMERSCYSSGTCKKNFDVMIARLLLLSGA